MSQEKGICRLTIVPVRAESGDAAEMVTQLLFGDHYAILEISEDTKWLKIQINYDQYEGWIDRKQHTSITEEYYSQINNSDYKISTDFLASLLYKKNKINVVIGSVLPISTNEIFKMEEHLAYNGESKSLSQKRDFEFLKEVALNYQGAPYLWGGKTPFGIDCSGFTQQVFKICGYKLQRDAWQQAQQGTTVQALSDAVEGDIAFFNNDDGKVIHTGILLTDQKIIHASGCVRIDQITEEGILNTDAQKITHKLSSIKRLLM
ncbi:MAG: C40 family peptidase [Bacteroidota bacterium]